MAKSRKRTGRKHRQPKSTWPGGRSRQLIDRAHWLRPAFIAGVRERYEVRVELRDLRTGRFVIAVPVAIPVYADRVTLRIELTHTTEEVYVEGFPGTLKHTYGNNRLCMWYPSDPASRRWTSKKGLLALVETALVHLFRERYYQEHPDEGWPGEEAPHPAGTEKVDRPVKRNKELPPTRSPAKLSRAA